jgi:hypothetical protein
MTLRQADRTPWEESIGKAALALAERMRQLQLDSGFLLSCYSGLWTGAVRREIGALSRAVDELASGEAHLPAPSSAALARAVAGWKVFHAAVAHCIAAGPDPGELRSPPILRAPAKELLVACREELERFGRNEPSARAAPRRARRAG